METPNWGITPVPERLRVLGTVDTTLLWTNLGVSLLVLVPPIRWITAALIGLTNVLMPGKGLKRGPFVSEAKLLALAESPTRSAAAVRAWLLAAPVRATRGTAPAPA